MLCGELVHKSSGTRWKCRNSSSAGVNERNHQLECWETRAMVSRWADRFCCVFVLFGWGLELPRQLQGCTCVWHVLQLFLQCSRCHTHAQLCHGLYVQGVCSGNKKKKGSLITQGFGTMSILGTPAVGTKRQQEHKDFAWSSIFLLFFTHKP